MSTTTAPIEDDPITIAWENIAFYLCHAQGLFGLPAQMAKRVWIKAADHKAFCAYMRPLEMMVRRIIFVMALKLAPMTLPEPPERKFRERSEMPVSTGAHFDPTKPETWRVSFRVSTRSAGAPAGTLPSPAHNAGEGAGAPKLSAAASAQRLEALIRAYEQRDQHAAALARKIARDGAATRPLLTRPDKKKLAHKPVWGTLFDIIPLAEDAYQHWLHAKLDALAPNTS